MGHVARSTDGGKTWTSLDTGFSANPVDVYLDPNVNTTMYAVPASGTVPTGPGGVYVSTNGGGAWTLIPVAPQSAPNDAIVASAV